MNAYSTEELTHVPALATLYLRAARRRQGPLRELPTRRLLLRDQPVREHRLRKYSAVCGFQGRGRLPATYPHMVAFGPSLVLMTGSDFPFPLLGLVHVANTVEQLRPIGPNETLTYQVWAEDLRPHPKGQVFDIKAAADDGTTTVWRSTSTYLRRGAGEEGARWRRDTEGSPQYAVGEELTRQWRVPAATGRRYASASGDRNPIHLHSLTAKPFGFSRSIAHGMWSKARCLAELQSELPDAFRVEVDFRAPLLLPATARFTAVPTTTGWRFGLQGETGRQREHLRGIVSAL